MKHLRDSITTQRQQLSQNRDDIVNDYCSIQLLMNRQEVVKCIVGLIAIAFRPLMKYFARSREYYRSPHVNHIKSSITQGK